MTSVVKSSAKARVQLAWNILTPIDIILKTDKTITKTVIKR